MEEKIIDSIPISHFISIISNFCQRDDTVAAKILRLIRSIQEHKYNNINRDDDVPPSIPSYCIKESRVVGRACYENPDLCNTISWEEIQSADILILNGGTVELYWFNDEIKQLIDKYFPKP